MEDVNGSGSIVLLAATPPPKAYMELKSNGKACTKYQEARYYYCESIMHTYSKMFDLHNQFSLTVCCRRKIFINMSIDEFFMDMIQLFICLQVIRIEFALKFKKAYMNVHGLKERF
ncbi:hypothetical protein ACT7DH_05830 [Bacillus pacificus]